MEWVRKFMVKARSEGHLGQTPILPDGQAIIDFPSLTEKKPDERWAIYFQIKGKQRRDRLANAGWITYFSFKCIQQAMVVRRFDV